jgi:hypothetical protein
MNRVPTEDPRYANQRRRTAMRAQGWAISGAFIALGNNDLVRRAPATHTMTTVTPTSFAIKVGDVVEIAQEGGYSPWEVLGMYDPTTEREEPAPRNARRQEANPDRGKFVTLLLKEAPGA